MKRIDLLHAYLYNLYGSLENEEIQLKNNVRYRNPMDRDLLQYIKVLSKMELLQEVTAAVIWILGKEQFR